MSTSQSVLDSQADAETLRLFARTDATPMLADDIGLAEWQAVRGATLAYPLVTPDQAAACARIAARAAFRAVPGLRPLQDHACERCAGFPNLAEHCEGRKR